MEKNCKTCVSGGGECGKRNMCVRVISDDIVNYMLWKPKNTKFPCGETCWQMTHGLTTCDECSANFNSTKQEKKQNCENCKFGLTDNLTRGQTIECILHHPSCVVDGCDRWKAKERSKCLNINCTNWTGIDKTGFCDICRNKLTLDEMRAMVEDHNNSLPPVECKVELVVGTKYDNGKPRIGEMVQDFMKPLLQVCKVWEFGAKEYSKSNWKKVENGADRYTNAMIRHFIAEDTEVIDKQTGLHHAVAVAWNALARLYFIIKDGE